jgi:CheY-like chemotaxis protein
MEFRAGKDPGRFLAQRPAGEGVEGGEQAQTGGNLAAKQPRSPPQSAHPTQTLRVYDGLRPPIRRKLAGHKARSIFSPTGAAENTENKSPPPLQSRQTPFMPKTKILAVDDDRAITSLMKRMLERLGLYEVREENLSTNALRTAQEFVPDIVLLDWQMPIMDGAEVAVQILAEPALSRVPIIFITGFGQRARKFGYPCLEKPINAQELVERIEESLEHR